MLIPNARQDVSAKILSIETLSTNQSKPHQHKTRPAPSTTNIDTPNTLHQHMDQVAPFPACTAHPKTFFTQTFFKDPSPQRFSMIISDHADTRIFSHPKSVIPSYLNTLPTVATAQSATAQGASIRMLPARIILKQESQ